MIPLWRNHQTNSSFSTEPVCFVAAVRPIRQDVRGPESGPAPTPALDLPGVQQRLEHPHLIAVPSGQQEGQRPSMAITFHVDLRPEAAL